MLPVHDSYPGRRPEPWREPDQPGGSRGDGTPPWLAERLFDRRVIMLHGPLTGPVASQTAAALLTLDAMGSEPIQLHMATADGELSAAYAVVDAIDALRAPVRALVTAEVGGAGIAVLAAADRRTAYPHARIRLVEPRAASVSGTADEVAAAAGQYLRELEELALRLVAVTGQPRSRVEDDLSAGRILTAEQAREYGLVDEVAGPRPT
jgi:ATP-dependent Clp protease, protease subunit